MPTRLRTRLKLGLLGTGGVLLLILLFQNTETVNLNILFWEIPIPKILLMAICVLIGLLAGWTIFKPPWKR